MNTAQDSMLVSKTSDWKTFSAFKSSPKKKHPQPYLVELTICYLDFHLIPTYISLLVITV